MDLNYFLNKYLENDNMNEIMKIKDDKIMNIKIKYQKLRLNALKDEHNISDSEFGRKYLELKNEERKELIELFEFSKKNSIELE